MKKYSFVIVTYQMKNTLRNTVEALNRLKGFRRDEFEVIISDDGSTDGTYEFIKDCCRNFDMKYVFTGRDHLSCRNRARNNGIKQASGEVIILMDGDILAPNDLLIQFERCYTLDKDIVVAGARIMLDKEVEYQDVLSNNIFDKYSLKTISNNMLDDRYRKYNILSYNAGSFEHSWLMAHTNIISIPSKCFVELGLFDEEIKGWGFDESELMFRIFKNNYKFVINHQIEVLHQPHNEIRDTPENTKVIEFRNNISYFFAKHQDAIDYLPLNLADYFMEDRMIELFKPKKIIKHKIEIVFKESLRISSLKQHILDLADKEGLELVIVDFVESTDLDIWIQLLEQKNAIIKYFPASKGKLSIVTNYNNK